jgi:hypothetical protein
MLPPQQLQVGFGGYSYVCLLWLRVFCTAHGSCNLVWGVTVGGAMLPPQQLQVRLGSYITCAFAVTACVPLWLKAGMWPVMAAAAAWQVPALSPQQASNLVWGLAVGGAMLPPQQLQVRPASNVLCVFAVTEGCRHG